MSTVVLKRQFITDAEGNPVAVILPLDEYTLVKDILERQPSIHEHTSPQVSHSVRETTYFGIWAGRRDMQGISSREWLNNLRAKQWARP